MKTITAWLSDWRHALTALGFGALALLAGIFVPLSRWEKLAQLVERIVEDPAGALAFIAVVGGAVTTLRGAWLRQPPPPALVLLAALVLAPLTGCGAPALRTHATIGAVAAVTLGQAAPLVAPACDAALTACRGAATCIDETAERCRAAAAAVEGLTIATRGYVDAIEVASLADEGAALPALLMGLSRLVVRWAEVVALLARWGIELPALPAGVGALLGGAS